MARGRGAGLQDLSQSWDPVQDIEDERFSSDTDDEPETRQEHHSRPSPTTLPEQRPAARRRTRQSTQSGLSDLVMPASPDAIRPRDSRTSHVRQSTPHFRLNQRSLTSDAGRLNTMSSTSESGHLRSRAIRTSVSELGKNRPKREPSGKENQNILATLWHRLLAPSISYLLDIAALVLNHLKPILGYLLLLYLIVGGTVFGLGFFRNSVHNALTPICRLPGAAYLNLSFCAGRDTTKVKGVAEFDKLVEAQSAFDEVLSSSSASVTLPFAMKRSEGAIRDLRNLVAYSSLPSRNELAFEFTGFIDTAKKAGEDLSRFNSRIARAVDQILVTNRWTLSTIEGVTANEKAQGRVSSWIGTNLNIFAPFQPLSLSQDLLLDQYLRHTSAIEDQIERLMTEAQSLLTKLDDLDKRLDVIHSLATKDDVTVKGSKEELFSSLWTKFGGNRLSIHKLEQKLELLGNVGAYRRIAWAHVTTTIVKLQAIRDNLEDLREQATMPNTVGDKVPLEVHINAITLGIKRLEQQRDNSRKIEADYVDGILNPAKKSGWKAVDSTK